jgi:hypothetical protein
MANFLRMLIDYGRFRGNQIFTRQTIRLMETPESSEAARAGFAVPYSKGMRIWNLKGLVAFRGHGGSIDGFRSSLRYSRELGVGYVIAGNGEQGGGGIRNMDEWITRYLEKSATPHAPAIRPLDVKAVEPFLGYYKYLSVRNELSAFMDTLQHTGQLYVEGGKLYFKEFQTDPVELLPLSSNSFRAVDDNLATYFFHVGSDGKAMLTWRDFSYEKAPAFTIVGKQVGLIACVAVIASALVVALWWIGLLVARKRRFADVGWRLLPLLGAAGLLGAFFAMGSLFENKQEFASINWRTGMVFSGTLGFAILSAAALTVGWLKFKKNWSLLGGYYVVVGLAMTGLTGYLASYHWIGMQLWKY